MEQVVQEGIERGASGLLMQFLLWVDAQPRSYGETMDAWRTSCPRLSIWEDAVGEGLVEVDHGAGSRQGESMVRLTAAGSVRLGVVVVR